MGGCRGIATDVGDGFRLSVTSIDEFHSLLNLARFAGGEHSSFLDPSGEERTAAGSAVWFSDSVDGRWVASVIFPPKSSVIATAAMIVILSWTGFDLARTSLVVGVAAASVPTSGALGPVSGPHSKGTATMGLSLDGGPCPSAS